jgi:hypothetical protein
MHLLLREGRRHDGDSSGKRFRPRRRQYALERGIASTSQDGKPGNAGEQSFTPAGTACSAPRNGSDGRDYLWRRGDEQLFHSSFGHGSLLHWPSGSLALLISDVSGLAISRQRKFTKFEVGLTLWAQKGRTVRSQSLLCTRRHWQLSHVHTGSSFASESYPSSIPSVTIDDKDP